MTETEKQRHKKKQIKGSRHNYTQSKRDTHRDRYIRVTESKRKKERQREKKRHRDGEREGERREEMRKERGEIWGLHSLRPFSGSKAKQNAQLQAVLSQGPACTLGFGKPQTPEEVAGDSRR